MRVWTARLLLGVEVCSARWNYLNCLDTREQTSEDGVAEFVAPLSDWRRDALLRLRP